MLSLSAPVSGITPATLGLVFVTSPSLSAAVEFNPLIIRGVAAVPVWAVAIKFEIF